MSLLETFFMKFQSEGLEKISSETEGTSQKADKMGNSFVQNGTKIIKALAPVVGLAALFNRTLSFASQAEEMSYLAQNTGMAVEKFQALAIAAENYGGSAEGIAGSLQGLNTNLQNMKFGKGGGGVEEAAITYGINLYGENGLATAEELLMNVAERFESLDSMQQLDLGQRLGLDEGTIRLLQTGVENVQNELARGAKYSLFSKEDIENSRQFQRTMRDIKLGLSQIFGIVARSLLPAFSWVGDKLRGFVDFLSQHADFVKGFFISLSALLTVLAIKSVIAFAPVYGFIAAIFLLSAAFGGLYAILSKFSFLSGDFSKLKEKILSFFDWLLGAWQKVVDWVSGGALVDWMKKKIGIDADVNMNEVKNKLTATQVPLASVSQGTIAASYSYDNRMFNSSENSNQNIKINQVTINSQATNAAGIRNDFENYMQGLMINAAKKASSSRIS